MDAGVLRVRLLNRCVDLFCDLLVVALLLASVAVGLLPRDMAIATIGYSMRSLVHPSLSLGVFSRVWPGDDTIERNGAGR